MSETNEFPPVMTFAEAALYLRISKAHLSNIINGNVPGVPVLRHTRAGRRVLIRREWADQWLEATSVEQSQYRAGGLQIVSGLGRN